MDAPTFINTVILTAAVFAALISSIANIVISLINNHRLKSIEKEKRLNDIDKYRYSRLYDLVVRWHEYDSEYTGQTASEIAHNRLVNMFLDDTGRYDLAKPLLDKSYIEDLEKKKEDGNKLLEQLVSALTSNNSRSEDISNIKERYFDAGKEFSASLKSAINDQLATLLQKTIKIISSPLSRIASRKCSGSDIYS